MKTKYILAASAFVLLGACDESEYESENLVPEQYHKVLYINNSGTIDMICIIQGKTTPVNFPSSKEEASRNRQPMQSAEYWNKMWSTKLTVSQKWLITRSWLRNVIR